MFGEYLISAPEYPTDVSNQDAEEWVIKQKIIDMYNNGIVNDAPANGGTTLYHSTGTTVSATDLAYCSDVTYSTGFYSPWEIVSISITEKGTLEAIHRRKSIYTLAVCPPRPAADEVVKHIYGVQDGKIVLLRTVTGRHIPAYTVEETIEFDD